ncbi:hypothetical protein GCM10009775_28560 [Microbacterium aoyamense]|uniref:ATP synthase protein I n=1 Tax=Microbacterium aoyamense TaxID=344166 RepID=A0ABP5B9G2_9MICO|nr:hypothetical protein [Microbacterium aoyamense]
MTSPKQLSSTPILRTTLIWSGVATAVLAVLGAVIGFLVAGTEGLWSALAGVLLAAVFLAITGISILIANRWYGDPLFVQLFFGIVMGGWLLKFVIFLVVLFTLRGQPWLNPTVFFFAVVISILTSLAIDVVVMLRMRTPYVGEATLPTVNPEENPEDADDSAPRT